VFLDENLARPEQTLAFVVKHIWGSIGTLSVYLTPTHVSVPPVHPAVEPHEEFCVRVSHHAIAAGQDQVDHRFPEAAVDANGVFGQDDRMLVFRQRFLHAPVLHALGDAFGQRLVDQPQVSKVLGIECGEEDFGHSVDQWYEHVLLSGVEKPIYIHVSRKTNAFPPLHS